MASFTALNIEPDDQVDDEVDNTKELQIEEALKLYQAALKLHSQGPASYPQAASAYTNLFKSEIFKYPESETEFRRIDKHPELEYTDVYSLGLDASGGGVDGAQTLPQILYLAYKNHGQFILDCVKSRLRLEPMAKPALDYQVQAAIDNFALALASDESDTELWRRASRIGATLGSKRIARYCLEAAVEVDDDPTVAELDPAALEEGFAGEQLKESLEVLGDETALSHPIMAPFRKKSMPGFLTKHMDPYPFLPDTTKLLRSTLGADERLGIVQPRMIITVENRTWHALGTKLCDAFLATINGSDNVISTTGLIINLPPEIEQIERGLPPAEDNNPTEDQVMKDVPITESPTADSDPAIATPVTGKSDDQSVEVITTTTTVPLADEPPQQSVTLPTRKRSQSTAGIRETPEEDSSTQKRSKRIRNRDNTTEGQTDPTTQYTQQLKVFEKADEDTFKFVGGLLQKLGVDELGSIANLQEALSYEEKTDPAEIMVNTVLRDLRDVLRSWDDAKASEFINGNAADILGSSVSTANAGLAAFLEHSKTGPQKLSILPTFCDGEGLANFVETVDASWMSLQDIVWEYVFTMLASYRTSLWPEDLKIVIVRLISFMDSEVFSRIKFEMEHAQEPSDLHKLEEMTESLFELHIDIYSRITNPNSAVPYDTRLTTKERLDRWADLAADVVQSRGTSEKDELSMRYLWASVFYATMADNVSREHKVLCWSDLQALLQDSGKPVIELQNNAVMPEISAEAAEREVSKLTTMDFFFNLFQTDRSDPLAIIETLEPVLDPESACAVSDVQGNGLEDAMDSTPAALREMWKFLQTGSTSLRLFLWQRLNEAYASIGYSTKVLSCNLKSIEVIVAALRSADFADLPAERRQHRLLTWFKALDELLVKALTLALNDAAACFEIIDERHIKSTCSALAQLTQILHAASVFDDEVRVGMNPLPQTPVYAPHGTFSTFTNKLREMQVRTWALQYTLIKEAMTQNQELFPTPDNDLADYLALVHYSLGMRKSCKASNKIFLKMMKVEMIRFKHIEKWEDYLGQVLFDLFGLRLGVGVYLLEDHGCPTEQLDRRTVLNIADQVILLANRMSMKDLLRHELKTTIEKMQTAVGLAKSTPHMLHNLRNYTEYLKTSLRPLDMYKAWRGQVLIDSVPVSTPESPLADKGWYFLLGMINLTKFRSQKRLGPGAQTDDLRVGVSFLRLQLQFTSEHWETWYRLAQSYDYELEEEVLWSADKINNHRSELTKNQRMAIHCYMLALSTAVRNADDSFSTAEKLSEMYYDFGMRIYSSSREPFGMEAFWTDEYEKHMSGSGGMYKKPLHEELSRYRAWKYAAKLFRESLRDRPTHWMGHFMLGKCLWKMYCKADEEWDEKLRATRPSMDAVLRAFVNAINHVPKPKDNRQEPILEPHYKLVSIVHKLVMMRAMEPQAGADLLQKQFFTIRKGGEFKITKPEEWEPFVLDSLRHLRNSDKQHWHHRMIARAANILYDDNHPDYAQAQNAKQEFRESIFTKTMHIQVWKPDAERPGRHCVYMERYVLYMTKLLWITDDKASMEALVKRVRKKGNDFHRFEKVWTETCNTYLKMIRRSSNIPPSMDDVFKNVPHDEFDNLCDRLTAWTTDPNSQNPALEALRESSELKKLNSGLMKSTPIDDLINDAWAVLYTQVGKTLPGPDPSTLHMAQTDGASHSPAAAAVRAMGPMSLNNLVMDMNGTQINVPLTIAGSEPSRPRKMGISRRDVLKRAELAVSRIPDIPRAVAPATSRPRISEPPLSMPVGSSGEQDQKQRSEQRSASVSTPRVDEGTSVQQENEQAEQEERREDQESERGSVHDSADDESDLSDVPDMDDVEAATIFPNLVRGDDDDDGSSDGEEASTPAKD